MLQLWPGTALLRRLQGTRTASGVSTFKSCTFCLQRLFLRFVSLSQQTETISVRIFHN